MINVAGVAFVMGSSSRVAFGPFPEGTQLRGITVSANSSPTAILYVGVGASSSVPASEAEFGLNVRTPYNVGQTTPGWTALAFPAGFSTFLPLDLVLLGGETYFVVQYEGSGAAVGTVGVVVQPPVFSDGQAVVRRKARREKPLRVRGMK